MNPPSSSTLPPFNSTIISKNSMINCEVCGKQGHGNHFGAITCRACAAFFRRTEAANNLKLCNTDKKCKVTKSGWLSCKRCRLQKCWEIGMTIDNFRIKINSSSHRESIKRKIPPSMDTFLSRTNLIIYCTPLVNDGSKTFIDVQFLINKAEEILSQGSETPVFAVNSLEKLALGLQKIRGSEHKKLKNATILGQEETFEMWQYEILKLANWLTYFSEFQQLPLKLQLKMLKGIWNVWSRLEKLSIGAMARREKVCESGQIVIELIEDRCLCDLKKLEFDTSWRSRYTYEQLKFFGYRDPKHVDFMIESLLDLQPTDVELSYMMCQLCFHHVGKRYQGEILKVTDQLQETLSNHLHDYYVNRLKMPKYSIRIANMMKINNLIQQEDY